MVEQTVKVHNERGIHMRPSMFIIDEASKYDSDITINVVDGEHVADAKSIMQMTMLGAKRGDEIVIKAKGSDEEQAVKGLVDLITSHRIDFVEDAAINPRTGK